MKVRLLGRILGIACFTLLGCGGSSSDPQRSARSTSITNGTVDDVGVVLLSKAVRLLNGTCGGTRGVFRMDRQDVLDFVGQFLK